MQYGEPTQNASAFSFVPGTYEATGLPWKAKTSMKMRGKAVPADRVSVRHDRIPVVRCRLPETSSPDGPFLRGAPVFAVRFGLAAAFVSPMPSDLSVGGSLPDEVPFGASVLGRRLLLIYLIARPDGGGYLKIVLTRADSVRADRGRPSGDGRPDVRAKVAAVCLGQ